MDELSADPLFRSGLSDHAGGRLDRAERAYRSVLAREPAHLDAQQMLAVVAYQTGHAPDAVTMLRALVRRRPDRGDLWTNLALALEFSGRLGDAEGAGRRALACTAAPPQAVGNLANILRQLWKLSEADTLFRRALAQSPQDPGLHYNFSLSLLAEGALAEGWREFRWRERMLPPPAWSGPRWDGAIASGLTLRVFSEQGLGDTLLFARYLKVLPPDVHVQLDVPGPLRRLLADSFPDAELVIQGSGRADAGVSLLSLPELLGGDLRSVDPYLCAQQEARAEWRRRLQTLPGLKVGLVWAGGSRPGELLVEAVDRRRSLTLAQLRSVLEVEGVSFVCLQVDRRDPAVEGDLAGEMHDWTPQIGDFADTAALVQEPDLVVCVDTAAAHLAGAMGCEVWLLSRFDACWRWPPPDVGPSWHATARQFRQDELGEWDAPIASLRDALAERARTEA